MLGRNTHIGEALSFMPDPSDGDKTRIAGSTATFAKEVLGSGDAWSMNLGRRSSISRVCSLHFFGIVFAPLRNCRREHVEILHERKENPQW